MSPSKKTGSGRRSGLQDSTGSASGTANTEDIPLDELEDGKVSFSHYYIAHCKSALELDVCIFFHIVHYSYEIKLKSLIY